MAKSAVINDFSLSCITENSVQERGNLHDDGPNRM